MFNSLLKGISGLRLTGLLAVAAVPSAMLFAAEQSETPAAQEAAVADAAAVATAINSEVDKLAPTASIADYEASIMFAISQTNADDEIILSALDIVAARPNLPETLKQAIENVRRTISRKKLARGTGALGDAGFSSFSSPSIGLGGGSTNYTN